MYWLNLFGLCVCILHINSLEFKRHDINPEQITNKGVTRDPWFITVDQVNYGYPRNQRFRVSVRKKTISPQNDQISQSQHTRKWRFKNYLNSPVHGHAVSQLNSNENLKKNVLPFTNNYSQSQNDYIFHTHSDERDKLSVYTALPSFKKLSHKKVKNRFKGTPTSKLFIKPGDYRAGRVSRNYDNIQYNNDNYDERSGDNIFESYEEVSEEQKRIIEDYLKKHAAREGSSVLRFSDIGLPLKLSPGEGPDPGTLEAAHARPDFVIHNNPGEGPDPGSLEDLHAQEYLKKHASHDILHLKVSPGEGPDPGTLEAAHARPDFVIHNNPGEGPDPGSLEDLHAQEYLKKHASTSGYPALRFSDNSSPLKKTPGEGPDPGTLEAAHARSDFVIHNNHGEGPDLGSLEDLQSHDRLHLKLSPGEGSDPGIIEAAHARADFVIYKNPEEGSDPGSRDLHSHGWRVTKQEYLEKRAAREGYPALRFSDHENDDDYLSNEHGRTQELAAELEEDSGSHEASNEHPYFVNPNNLEEGPNAGSMEDLHSHFGSAEKPSPGEGPDLGSLEAAHEYPNFAINDIPEMGPDPGSIEGLDSHSHENGVDNYFLSSSNPNSITSFDINFERDSATESNLKKEKKELSTYLNDDENKGNSDERGSRELYHSDEDMPVYLDGLPLLNDNVILSESKYPLLYDAVINGQLNWFTNPRSDVVNQAVTAGEGVNIARNLPIVDALIKDSADHITDDQAIEQTDIDRRLDVRNFAILNSSEPLPIVETSILNVALPEDYSSDVDAQDLTLRKPIIDDDFFIPLTPTPVDDNFTPPPINVLYDDHIILPHPNTDIGLNDNLYQELKPVEDSNNVLHSAQLDTLTDDSRDCLDGRDLRLPQLNLNQITPLENTLLQVCNMKSCSISNIRQCVQNSLALPIAEDTNLKRKLNDLYQLLKLVMNIANDPQLKSLHAIYVLTELIDHVNQEIAEKALNRKTLEIPSACHTVYTQNAWLKQYILALHEQIINLQECKPYYDEFFVDNHNHGHDTHEYHDQSPNHDQNHSHDNSHGYNSDQSLLHGHAHSHGHGNDQGHGHIHNDNHDDGHLIADDNILLYPFKPIGPIVFPEDSEYRPQIDHPQINPYEQKPIVISANDLNIINNQNDGQLYPLDDMTIIQPLDDKTSIFEDQPLIPVTPLPNPDYPLNRFDIKQYDSETDCSAVCVVDEKVVQHIWNKYSAGIEINELEHSILDRYVLKPNGEKSSHTDLTRNEPKSHNYGHNHYSLVDHRNALYNTFVQINLRNSVGARCADRCKYPLRPISPNESNPYTRLFISPGGYQNPVSDSLQRNSYKSSLDPIPKITNNFPLGHGIVPAEEKALSHEKENNINDRYIKDTNDNFNDYHSLLDNQYNAEPEIVKTVDSDLPGLKNRMSSFEEYYNDLPTPKKLADLKNYPYHSSLDYSSPESDSGISNTYLDLLKDRFSKFQDYYDDLPTQKRPDIKKYLYFHTPFVDEYVSQEKGADIPITGSELPALTDTNKFSSWEEYYDNIPPKRPEDHYPEDLSNSVEYYDLTLPPDNMNSVFKPLLQNYVLITSEDLRTAYKMIVQTLKQVIKYLRRKNVNGRVLDFIVMEMIEIILQEMEDGKLCKESDRYQLFSAKLISTIKNKINVKQNFSAVGVRDQLTIQTILESPQMQEILGKIFEPMKLILKVERNVFSDYFR